MKLNKRYRRVCEKWNVLDEKSSTDFATARKLYRNDKKMRRLKTVILGGAGIGVLLNLGGAIYYGSEKSEFGRKSEISSIYQEYNFKKDSLENAYQVQLDSLSQYYEMKLNQLEKDLK